MMNLGIMVLILVVVYCLVNAAVFAQMLCWESRLKRFLVFFKQALLETALSQGVILIIQNIFLIYFCRLQRLFYNIFDQLPPSCPIFDKPSLLLQYELMMVILFGLVGMLIQFFLFRHIYRLDDERLLRILMISNAASCAARYGLVQIFL